MKEVSFNAPWGAPLVLMTAVCAVICLFLPVPGLMLALGKSASVLASGMFAIPNLLQWIGWLVVAVPLLLLVVSAVFMVRGYVLTDDSLIIKRPGWEHRLDLSRLTSATVDPNAFQGSMLLFGNGGFFSFIGWYRNKKLGVYRAYATDARKAVVLRFADKTVVVTPDDPQKFTVEIKSNQRTFLHET
jgi:hypothetical protein